MLQLLAVSKVKATQLPLPEQADPHSSTVLAAGIAVSVPVAHLMPAPTKS